MTREDVFDRIEKAKFTNILRIDYFIIDDEIWNKVLKVKKLKFLVLNFCEIQKIPNKIIELEELIRLNLSNNIIEIIPNEIFKLKKIEKLNFSYNKIKEIPKEITELKQLLHLDLSNNEIKILPKEILKLKNLRSFEIERNLITKIPKAFFKLNFRNFSQKNSILYTTHFEAEVYSEFENYILIFENKGYKKEEVENYIFFEKENTSIIIYSDIFEEYEKQFHILGDFQKETLYEFRSELIKWLEENNIKEYDDYFHFEKEAFNIDFELLKNLHKAQEDFYNAAYRNLYIPVNELVEYIGEENVNFTLEKEEWKGSQKISKVEIENFKLFDKIEFETSPSVNIILGHNGLGKSSILQAITLALIPSNNRDKNSDFINFIRFGKNLSSCTIHWENEKRKRYIAKNELKDASFLETPHKLLLSYGVNLNADINKPLEENIIKELQNGNAKAYSTKSIFKDFSTDFNNPLHVLYQLHKDRVFNQENEEIIKLIVGKINEYLELIDETERITLKEENGNFYFEDLNKIKLELHNLSEGYKDHILLISDIIIRIIAARNEVYNVDKKEVTSDLLENARGVIIIDEFDRHLHPTWQRKLLSQLKKDFKNIQFFLTTHNVFSLQSAVGENAIVLSPEKKKYEINLIEAKNVLGIIRKYYTKEIYDFDTQNLLDSFNLDLEKIYSGNFDLAYKKEFKDKIQQLLSKGFEFEQIVANDLVQLNSHLETNGFNTIEL